MQLCFESDFELWIQGYFLIESKSKAFSYIIFLKVLSFGLFSFHPGLITSISYYVPFKQSHFLMKHQNQMQEYSTYFREEAWLIPT